MFKRIGIELLMKIKLVNIASLQSGVYLKASEDASADKAYLLGLRDFDDALNYLGTAVEVVRAEVKEKYIIEDHHVLFSSRLKFNAFPLPKDSPVTYVASSSFIIIKPNLKKVLSEYLIWFLNHPETQSKFSSLSQATGRVPYINLKKLEEIEIQLPELAIQEEIVHINMLRRKEKQLMQNLVQKKEQYIQSILLKTSKQ